MAFLLSTHLLLAKFPRGLWKALSLGDEAVCPSMQRVAFPKSNFLSGLDASFSSPSFWHAETGFQLGHMDSMYRLIGLVRGQVEIAKV